MSTKTKKLTIRERKLIKGLAAGLTPTEAMRQAGYSENTAKGKAGQKVAESRIQASIQEMMEERGLTKNKLLCKLEQGLEATKVISANVVAPSGEGMSDAHGTTKDFIEVPDFATQHKFLDTALKVGNYYPAEKKEITGPAGGPIETRIILEIIDEVGGK